MASTRKLNFIEAKIQYFEEDKGRPSLTCGKTLSQNSVLTCIFVAKVFLNEVIGMLLMMIKDKVNSYLRVF